MSYYTYSNSLYHGGWEFNTSNPQYKYYAKKDGHYYTKEEYEAATSGLQRAGHNVVRGIQSVGNAVNSAATKAKIGFENATGLTAKKRYYSFSNADNTKYGNSKTNLKPKSIFDSARQAARKGQVFAPYQFASETTKEQFDKYANSYIGSLEKSLGTAIGMGERFINSVKNTVISVSKSAIQKGAELVDKVFGTDFTKKGVERQEANEKYYTPEEAQRMAREATEKEKADRESRVNAEKEEASEKYYNMPPYISSVLSAKSTKGINYSALGNYLGVDGKYLAKMNLEDLQKYILERSEKGSNMRHSAMLVPNAYIRRG